MRLRCLAVGIAAWCLAACSSSSNQPLTAALSVRLTGSGGGTVTSSPAGISCGNACSASFTQGAVVTLTATPDASSVFTGWSGGCSGTNATCQVTMGGANQSVTATFSPAAAATRLLSVSLGGNAGGTVSASPVDLSCSGSACSQDYDDGTVVTITAAPDTTNFPGATASFTGCDSSTATTCTVTMTGDRSVGVTFSMPVMHILTVNIGGTGGGTVTGPGLSCGSATLCTGTYAEGSTVTLTGTPDGSSTVSFSGCNISGNQCTVTMNADATVNVTFNPIVTHVISVTVNGDGTINSDQGGISCDSTGGAGCTSSAVIDGSTVTLSIAGTNPSAAWTGCDATTATTCTINLTADRSVSAFLYQDVGALQVAASLQGAHLSWTNPTAAGFSGTSVYVAAPSSAPVQVGTTTAGQNTFDIVGLYPGVHYTFFVHSNDGTGNGVNTQATTTFTGTNTDWPATDGTTSYSQNLLALDSNNSVRIAWNTDTLFFGLGQFNNPVTSLLNNPGDAFWVAIDTDPASDATGTLSTTVVGSNTVFWPFKANYVAELKVADAQGTIAVSLYDAVTGLPVSTTATGLHGAVDELSVSAADLGISPGPVRLAFVAVDTNSGWTYQIAPNYPGASFVSVLGYHASLIAGFDMSSHAFDLGYAKTTVASGGWAFTQLILHVSVDTTSYGLPAGHIVQIASNTPPFDTFLANSVYSLNPDATGKVFDGFFNLAAYAGPLKFHFVDVDPTGAVAPVDEGPFSAPKNRVYTMSGLGDAVMALNWGEVYSATHTVQLQFKVHTGGSPIDIAGNLNELGNWQNGCGTGTNNGLALTDTGTQDGNGTEIWSATLNLTNYDLVTGGPLAFKTSYGVCNFEGGTDHQMPDDVLNYYVMSWQAGDSSNF